MGYPIFLSILMRCILCQCQVIFQFISFLAFWAERQLSCFLNILNYLNRNFFMHFILRPNYIKNKTLWQHVIKKVCMGQRIKGLWKRSQRVENMTFDKKYCGSNIYVHFVFMKLYRIDEIRCSFLRVSQNRVYISRCGCWGCLIFLTIFISYIIIYIYTYHTAFY